MKLLKFSVANTKLSKLAKNKNCKVYSLDLPAGITCPGALFCKSRVVNVNNKLRVKDSPNIRFRCYSCMNEVIYPLTWELHRYNYNLIRIAKRQRKIYNLLEKSLPNNTKILRYHCSGDFFNQSYMNAAIMFASNHKDILFYGYTKSIHFWIKQLKNIPSNFILTASRGGKYDYLINEFNLKNCKVVFNRYQARKLGLTIDKDESLATVPNISFALQIHGVQPANTDASRYYEKIRRRKYVL